MNEYWDALTSRVDSAEAFILGQDIRTTAPSQSESSPGTGESSKQEGSRGGDVSPAFKHPSTVELSSPVHFTPDQLESIMEDGRIAFKNLILMSTITFIVSLSLMVLAPIAGLIFRSDLLALILGLLGVCVLLVLLLMKPLEKIQVALANMIQAQAIYLDLSNQFQIWDPAVRRATNVEEKQQASDALHSATTFTLKALQDYIERRPAEK